MFDTWTSVNRVTHNALRTIYQTHYDASSMPRPFYQYTRIRTKQYSYIALTEAAAKACVDAMLAIYTRTYRNWLWSHNKWMPDSRSTYQELVADVVAVHDDGATWHVDVQVNETAIAYSPSALSNIASAFTTHGLDWNYEE